MTVVLSDNKANSERIVLSLTDEFVMAESLIELDAELSKNPDEQLVVISPEIPLKTALSVAEKYRIARSYLGVVLVRNRLEIGMLGEALKSGIREVVAAGDVAALTEACKRSTAVSQDIKQVNSEEPRNVRAKLLLVFSSKGGCGKTTVSTNLAVALATSATKPKVCLVDFDLANGDIAIALQLEPTRTISDALGLQGSLDARLMSSLVVSYKNKCDALLAPTRTADADFIPIDLVEQVLHELSQMYDYVIIDAPPIFNDVVLKCFDMADSYLLLTTLDLPALKSLKVTLDTLESLGFLREKCQIILNRSDSKVGLSAQDIERTVGMPISIQIPMTDELPAALNEGTTAVEKVPTHAVAQAFRQLAQNQAQSGAFSQSMKPRRFSTLLRGRS